MIELLLALALQTASCTEAVIAPAEQRMSDALQANDADAALIEATLIIETCGTAPESFNARFYGGLLERERSNIQEAADYFDALPRDDPDYFYPVVNWTLVQAAALRGDTGTFRAERDLLRYTYLEALTIDAGDGARGRFVERFDIGGISVDAVEILRSREDFMQRYVFLFVPGPNDYLQAVSIGGYSGTREFSDSVATADVLALGDLWHGDLYDCHGHSTLTFFRAAEPDYERVRQIAVEAITDEIGEAYEAVPARVCAFDHFITPYAG